MSFFNILTNIGSGIMESVKNTKSINIKVERIFTCSTYTIGKMYINGEYVCDVLEDTDRGLNDDMSLNEIKRKKVYSETAIPTGKYNLNMNTVSLRFKDRAWAKPYGGMPPRFENVKGFDGVLIHPGNTDKDSSGCLLVGYNKVKGKVINSTVAFNKLMDKYLIPAKKKGEKITIEIVRKYKL